MRLSWACRAACFLSAITLACCSLALQLDVTESVDRRHEPRQPVWPGQYQVRRLFSSCQWLLAIRLVFWQIRSISYTRYHYPQSRCRAFLGICGLACKSWCVLAQVSYDVDVPYVSKLQSTPLRCPLFVLCGCFLSRSVLIGTACKTTSLCTSTGGQASTQANACAGTGTRHGRTRCAGCKRLSGTTWRQTSRSWTLARCGLQRACWVKCCGHYWMALCNRSACWSVQWISGEVWFRAAMVFLLQMLSGVSMPFPCMYCT